MVNIEQGALCAFGQDVLALRECAVEFDFCVGECELAHVLDALEPELLVFRNVEICVAEVAQYLQVAGLQGFVLRQEVVLYVAHAQACAAGFLAVCRADALACGANSCGTLRCLVCAVEHAVRGQYQVGAAADVEPAVQVVACRFKLLGLGHEEVWSDDASVADDVELPLVENARGDAAQDELLAIEDDGVAGVWTACEACHYVVFGCEDVHHLAFAFVSEDDAQQGIHFSFCHYVTVVCVILGFFLLNFSASLAVGFGTLACEPRLADGAPACISCTGRAGRVRAAGR